MRDQGAPEGSAGAGTSSGGGAPAPYGEGQLVAGNYRLSRILGQGGMGDVWLAHNETLDIDVALKLIRVSFGAHDAEERLLQEARAAAKLGHPAIVRVFDFGRTERGDPFIVMERLEGEDLATALVRRGRFAATTAVRTLLPIAHALSAAHAKGIIHRDLKPENVFLAKADGDRLQPKVVDFGIAKVERLASARLTQDGALLGSPAYMCPEQARGDDVDHRADVWSYCVVLYEAITGKQPFDGKNQRAIWHAIVGSDPPPLTDFGVGDAELSSILATGFDKSRDKRWASMRQLGAALAGWLLRQGVTEDIAGASLDAAWSTHQPDPDELDTPPPLEGAALPGLRRDDVTVRRRREREQRAHRILTVAAALGMVGFVAGIAIGRRSRPVGEVQGPAFASAGATVQAPAPAERPATLTVAPPAPRASGPIPVESLDQIPVDRTPAALPPSKAPAPKRATLVAGHRRSRVDSKVGALKDPFQ